MSNDDCFGTNNPYCAGYKCTECIFNIQCPDDQVCSMNHECVMCNNSNDCRNIDAEYDGGCIDNVCVECDNHNDC